MWLGIKRYIAPAPRRPEGKPLRMWLSFEGFLAHGPYLVRSERELGIARSAYYSGRQFSRNELASIIDALMVFIHQVQHNPHNDGSDVPELEWLLEKAYDLLQAPDLEQE